MKNNKLFLIKLIHTLIWIFYVGIIFYVLYSGITDTVTIYSWIAIALVMFEGLVLALFQWRCPLTVLGYRYTENRDVGFDIFLPRWLAKNNKLIFTAIFMTGFLLVLCRVFIK